MKKKTFFVDVKYNVTKTFFVYADTKEQAQNKAKRNYNNDKLEITRIIENIEHIGQPIQAINIKDITI